MALVRPSNTERSKWRAQCREHLSSHIFSRLGIVVEPSQVRLLPRAEDPYTWKVLPGKEYLFSKNISSHSIGVYKELCEGIDVAFEAVATPLRPALSSSFGCQGTLIPTTDISFSTAIENLQEQNQKLIVQVQELQDQLTTESSIRQYTEEQIFLLDRTNKTLEKDLSDTQVRAVNFERISEKYKETHRHMLSLLGSVVEDRIGNLL